MMAVIAGLALLLAVASRCLLPTDPQIHAMGNGLVSAIEDWRTRHGRYPRTLAEAGLDSPTRDNGGFRYHADRQDASFTLSIGEADGVEVQHDYFSKNPGWYCHD